MMGSSFHPIFQEAQDVAKIRSNWNWPLVATTKIFQRLSWWSSLSAQLSLLAFRQQQW
jgi:hypothetical protein